MISPPYLFYWDLPLKSIFVQMYSIFIAR